MNFARNSIQSAINSLDEGLANATLRFLLFLFLGIVVLGVHAWSQFGGLKEPEAMEYAQLARNLSVGRGFTTQCIRPVDFRHLEKTTGRRPEHSNFPDLRHGPAYPLVLAAGFRLRRPSFGAPPGNRLFAPESQVVVPVGILFSLATGLAVFLLGLNLFDRRTAVLATVLTFLNGALLESSISGSPVSVAMFLVTASTCAAVYSVHLWDQRRPWPAWLGLLVLSVLLCAAAFLTRYSLLILLPVVVLWLKLGFGDKQRLAVACCLVVFALAVTPWLIRNRNATGSALGLAPHAVLRELPMEEGQTFERLVEPGLHNVRVARAVKLRFRTNVRRLFERNFGLSATGIMGAFFLVSLFHRFDRRESERLKWCVVLGFALLAALVCVVGLNAISILRVFFPLIILCAAAFFYDLADRLSAYAGGWETVLSGLLIAIVALPVLLTVTGPRAPVPYPPYYPPLISFVGEVLDPEEVVCTDIPWATAWYGSRASVLLPNTVDDIGALAAAGVQCSALYLTAGTARPSSGRATFADAERQWSDILAGRVPPDFPLKEALYLPLGSRDQLLLTDRVRWPQATNQPASSPPPP